MEARRGAGRVLSAGGYQPVGIDQSHEPRLSNVCFRGQPGINMLKLSWSQVDPLRTWEEPPFHHQFKLRKNPEGVHPLWLPPNDCLRRSDLQQSAPAAFNISSLCAGWYLGKVTALAPLSRCAVRVGG